MNRRSLLKLLSVGLVGYTLDIDKLFWVPGQKKIFLPSKKIISVSEIISLELERIIPRIQTIFECDDVFYNAFKRNSGTRISSKEIRIPLQFR